MAAFCSSARYTSPKPKQSTGINFRFSSMPSSALMVLSRTPATSQVQSVLGRNSGPHVVSKYGFAYSINRPKSGKKIQKWRGMSASAALRAPLFVWDVGRSKFLSVFRIARILQRHQGSNFVSSISAATGCWHIGPHCCCGVYYLWILPDERAPFRWKEGWAVNLQGFRS